MGRAGDRKSRLVRRESLGLAATTLADRARSRTSSWSPLENRGGQSSQLGIPHRTWAKVAEGLLAGTRSESPRWERTADRLHQNGDTHLLSLPPVLTKFKMGKWKLRNPF